MCAAKRSAALQWAPQFFREPTPTIRDAYFIDRRIHPGASATPFKYYLQGSAHAADQWKKNIARYAVVGMFLL